MSTSTYQKRLLLQLLSKHRRLSSPDAQGFTLIELLVVIVILGVLGGVGYGAYVNQIGRANANTAATTATSIAKNCAALLVTGDQSDFKFGVNDTSVKASGTCATGAQSFTVQAGVGGNFMRTGQASILAGGAVVPSPIATP